MEPCGTPDEVWNREISRDCDLLGANCKVGAKPTV